MDEILKTIERETGVKGILIRHTGSGHKMYDFSGFRYTIPTTTSDRRAVRNAVAEVKRKLKKLSKVGTVGEQVIQKKQKRPKKRVEPLTPAKAIKVQVEALKRQNEAHQREIEALRETIRLQKETQRILELELAVARRSWWRKMLDFAMEKYLQHPQASYMYTKEG